MHYTINTKSLFHKGVCSSGENLGQNPSSVSKSNCHNLLEKSTQEDGWGGGGRSEIAAILNKYKNTLDNLIDSSDTKSLDQPDSSNRSRLIDKGLRNASRSRSDSPTLSEEDRLDEDVLVTLLVPTPKIRASQMNQRHDIAPFGSKSGRVQYENGQRGGEDRKS